MAARFTCPSLSMSARAWRSSDSSQPGTWPPRRVLRGPRRARSGSRQTAPRGLRAARASPARPAGRHPCASRAALTRCSAAEPLLVQRAQGALGILQRPARQRPARLSTVRRSASVSSSRACALQDRFVPGGQLRFQLRAPAQQLRALLHHAVHADAHGTLGRAARLHAHVQVARAHLQPPAPASARSACGVAPLLALRAEAGVPRFQLR